MHLLSLPGGGVSLEFNEEEFAQVKDRLRTAARRLGLPSRLVLKDSVTLRELRIGGERLTLSFEDGDPCIIAGRPGGEALLRTAVDGAEPAPLTIAAE